MGGNAAGKTGTDVELKRSLTMPLLIMFGLAYLTPTVVFNYYGVITVGTHGMMALAYIMTTVVMFFSAWSYARMAEVFPKAGSAYTYVQHSIGPRVGFLAGWLVLLDYLLLPLESYLVIGIYVHKYFPSIPVWMAVLAVVVLAAIINIIGMKTAATIDTIIVAAQIGFAVLFVIVIIRHVLGGGGAGTLADATAIYNAGEFSMNNILSSSAMLCVAFLGFDAVTTMAEEVENPRRTIPRAIMFIAVGAGVMFTIIAYFCQIGWPEGYLAIVDEDSGIFELLDTLGISVISDIFFIIDNLSGFVCAMAALSAVSRVMYSMGRDNVLPKKVFGKLSPKFHTPILCILIASAVQLCSLFFMDNYEGVVALVSFGAMSGFALVNLSVIMYFYVKKKRRDPLSTFKFLILPGIGLVVSVVLWLATERSTKIMGICWIVFGIIYLAFKTKGFRVLPEELKVKDEEEAEADTKTE